ncbi:hypothetical protein GCM10028819_24660 [Spirosoma humi]
MALFRKKTYADLTQLVIACQQQKPQAQHVFYERYKGRLMGICVRYAKTGAEAEDIFQEAFIKIFQHIHQLEKPEAADHWVKSVVVRTAINYYNRTTRQQERFTTYDELTDEPTSEDYQLLIDQQTSEALITLLNQLSDTYRVVINLYLVEGYTHAEIAALLAIPEATARSQYSRARQSLIKLIQKQGIERHEFFR